MRHVIGLRLDLRSVSRGGGMHVAATSRITMLLASGASNSNLASHMTVRYACASIARGTAQAGNQQDDLEGSC